MKRWHRSKGKPDFFLRFSYPKNLEGSLYCGTILILRPCSPNSRPEIERDSTEMRTIHCFSLPCLSIQRHILHRIKEGDKDRTKITPEIAKG